MTLKLNGSTGGSVSIDAPAATTGNADITFSLPVADGSNGEVLQTNGSGQLSFGSGSQWTTSGSNIYYTTGSVSVGTSTALGHKIEIADALQADANLSYSLAIYGNNTAATGNSSQIFLGALNGGTNRGCAIASVITANANAHEMTFKVSGPSATPTERARIDSSGRLLVGTSTQGTGDSQLLVSGANPNLRIQSTSYPNGYADLDFTAPANNGNTTHKRAKIRLQHTEGDAGWDSSLRFFVGGFADTERMRIANNGNLTCLGVYTETSAQAANVYVGSTGNIQRSTSSIKYKTDVEDMQDVYADSILQCRPVWYRSTCRADNPDWGWWGFIAEEVAAIDPRLVHWKTVEVTYDENGSAVETPCNPEPEGVAYERFVPHLLNLIKRQNTRIETLEAANAAQAATIAAFEARLTALEGGTN